MKTLLVVVNGSMFDAVLPLLKELRGLINLYCLFEVNFESTNLLPVHKIELDKIGNAVDASTISELEKYKDFIPLEKSRVLHVTVPRNVVGFIRSINGEYKEIKSIKPDFVYFYNVPDYAYQFIYFSNIPWATAVHDPKQHSSERFKWKTDLLRNLVFRKCQKFFLFSEALIPEFSSSYSIPIEKIHETRLAPYYHFLVNDYSIKKRNNLINALFFGRIESYKGVKFLLKGFKEYLEKGGGKINLTIAGRGYIETDIIDLDTTEGLTIINRFVPEPELVELLGNTDFVVCPYTDATQSGVIMSSYAFSKPVIATSVGGLVEMVENNKTGFIIPPANSEEICNALLKIEQDPGILNIWCNYIKEKYSEGVNSWRGIAIRLIEDLGLNIM